MRKSILLLSSKALKQNNGIEYYEVNTLWLHFSLFNKETSYFRFCVNTNFFITQFLK